MNKNKTNGKRRQATFRSPVPETPGPSLKSQLSNDLRFIRINDIYLVPKKLIDQIKGVSWTPQELYGLWPLFADSPFNLLYVLADEQSLIKGFVWASVNPLARTLFINTVSLDKEYQNRNLIIEKIQPFLEEIRKNLGLTDKKWITIRPKAFEKIGFKRSQVVLMEG